MPDPVPSRIPMMSDGGENNFTWLKWFEQFDSAPIGYGGIVATQDHILGTIDAGWTVLLADDGAVNNPVQVGQSPGNESLFLERQGVWQITTSFTLQFDELNAGRAIDVQLYNVTAAAEGPSSTLGVARNVEYLNYSAAFQLEVSTADSLTNEIQVRVGNGDTFTNVTQLGFRFEATLIDNL